MTQEFPASRLFGEQFCHPGKAARLFSPSSRPYRLPQGIVDIALEKVDVPVVGDLYAGVAQEFRDDLLLHPGRTGYWRKNGGEREYRVTLASSFFIVLLHKRFPSPESGRQNQDGSPFAMPTQTRCHLTSLDITLFMHLCKVSLLFPPNFSHTSDPRSEIPTSVLVRIQSQPTKSARKHPIKSTKTPFSPLTLHKNPAIIAYAGFLSWRDGRVVEGAGLENQ